MIGFKTTLISRLQISKIIHMCYKDIYEYMKKLQYTPKSKNCAKSVFVVINLVLLTVACFYSQKKSCFSSSKRLYCRNVNFLTTKNTTLKLHDPEKFLFSKFYLVQKLLLIYWLKKDPYLFPSLKSSYGPTLCCYFWGPALNGGDEKNKINAVPSIFMKFWSRNNLDQLDRLTP